MEMYVNKMRMMIMILFLLTVVINNHDNNYGEKEPSAPVVDDQRDGLWDLNVRICG
jgi:hypothetical protein